MLSRVFSHFLDDICVKASYDILACWQLIYIWYIVFHLV